MLNLALPLRELLLHRRQPDSSVVPCLFIIDTGTNVIISEACGPAMVAESTANLAAWRKLQPGAPVLLPPEADINTQLMLRRLLASEAPCTIPGCEGWRAQLKQELDKLPPDCPSCDRNQVTTRVVRALAPELAAYLADHPDYTDLQVTPPAASSRA